MSLSASRDGLPRTAFAYAPDDSPESWRLPYLTSDGAPDPATLPISAASIAEVPPRDLPAVKTRLRQAYRRWGRTEMPESIRHTSDEDDIAEAVRYAEEAEQAVLDAALREADDAELDAALDRAIEEQDDALFAIAYREASDDHPYGPWHGGKKGEGGGPGRLPTKAARTADLASKIGAENVGKPGVPPPTGKNGKAKGEAPAKEEAKDVAAKVPDQAGHATPGHEGWGTGPTVSADQAYADLAAGKSPNVAPRDVDRVLTLAAANPKAHPDLTDLQVAGTLKFGGDGLGIPRDKMPQLTPAFLDHMERAGVGVTRNVQVDPASLHPIQREISAAKVGGMVSAMRAGTMSDGAIMVSRDGYVLDGHHRWGAMTARTFSEQGVTMTVHRIDMDAKQLLPTALSWTESMGIANRSISERAAAMVAYAEIFAIIEASSDDHFYGPWRGGKAADGGGLGDTETRHADITGEGKDRVVKYHLERVHAVHEPYIEGTMRGVPTSGSPTVYMTGGGAASGKTVALLQNEKTGIPNAKRAAHINPDDAKVAIPEYRKATGEDRPRVPYRDENGKTQRDRNGKVIMVNDPPPYRGTPVYKGAAGMAHEESSHMAKAGVARALSKGHDVVYDTVGDTGIEKLTTKVGQMRRQGAKRVVADYATIPIKDAIARADARAKITKRYVHHSLIHNQHVDVARTFIAAGKSNLFDRLRLWDNTADGPPVLVAVANGKGGFRIHDRAKWDRFVATASLPDKRLPKSLLSPEQRAQRAAEEEAAA